jgi:hypothetical protein
MKSGRNSEVATHDNDIDLTPKRDRREQASNFMARSASAINVRKDFVDALPPPITSNRARHVKSKPKSDKKSKIT